jgi:hypothetical protein
MTLRYLRDENVTYTRAVALRRHGPDVVTWMIGDPGVAPPRTPDLVILEWCEAHDFVLITNNRRTMPAHVAEHLRQGRHVPGIFMLNPTLSMAETITNLLDAARLSQEGEYRDQIRHVPV